MPTLQTILLFAPLSVLVLILQYVAPGVGVLRRSPLKLSALEKIVLGTLLSISFQAAVIFLVGQFLGTTTYWLNLLFLAVGVLSLPQLFVVAKQSFASIAKHPWITALMLLCVTSLASTLALSWVNLPTGLTLQAGQLHDSSWHIALINNLQTSIPPEHPSSASLLVQQYHYFYDVCIASLVFVYRLPATVLYFQVFPFLLSFLLAGSCVIFARRVQPSITSGLLFLTFFGGSLAFVTPLFIPGIVWHESMFWVSQTFATMGNPQMIFSLATMLTVLWLIQLLIKLPIKAQHTSWWLHTFILTLIVSSFGFKSYGWLVMGGMYGVYLLSEAIDRRSLWPLGWSVGLGLLSLPFIGMVTGFSTSSFFFYPLWYLTSMVEAPDRLNIPSWRIAEDQARLQGSVLGVLKIQVIEFVIFWIGNLGTRVVWCFLPVLLIFRQLKLTRLIVIIAAGLAFSAAFPLFFLQRGAVWNSIQFWYYALILANIFAMSVVMWVWKVTTKLGRTRWIFGMIFIALSIPAYFPTQYIKLAKFEGITTEQTTFLASLNRNDRVLFCPSGSPFFKTALVTAASAAHIYVANTAQLAITDQKPEEADRDLEELFKPGNTEALKQVIYKNHISYVVCDDAQKQAQVITATQDFSPVNQYQINGWNITAVQDN